MLADGTVDGASLVTHVLPLDDYETDGILNDEDGHLRKPATFFAGIARGIEEFRDAVYRRLALLESESVEAEGEGVGT